MASQVSRRAVAKGTVWAIPTVSVTAAAPSLAASPVPVLNAENTVTFGVNNTGSSASAQYRVYSAAGGNVDLPNTVGACGPEVAKGKGATITGVTETFWLPESNLKFTTNGSPATSGWSTLARNTAQTNHYDTDGNTLYAYSTTYSGTPTTSGTTMCLGVQNWISTNATGNPSPVSYDAILTGMINGKAQSDAGTDVPLPSQ